MNSEAVKKLKLKTNYFIHPSVASEEPEVISKEKKGFRILSVGRFVPLKGFDITVRSFAKFYHTLTNEQKKNVKLTLVGKGPQKQFLQQLFVEENINEAAEIIEWLPRNELPKIYAGSSVFLFPTHEGAGMVVPEAMSYGLPVVCMNNCGPGEFIHPNSTLKTDYTSYDNAITDVADKLHQLYSQKNFYIKETELALERYEKLFKWQVRADLLKTVYETILIEKKN